MENFPELEKVILGRAAKLSKLLMQSTSSKSSLKLLADFIRKEVVKSDGIKIVQLGRDGESGTFTEYLYHSTHPEYKGKRKLFSEGSDRDHGLIEGGLKTRKGMVVTAEQNEDGSLRYACKEAGSKKITYRRPFDEDQKGEGYKKDLDKEHHMLLYPLRTYCDEDEADKVVGLVFLWQEVKEGKEPEPYSEDQLDILRILLPFLLLAFEHILLLERANKEKNCLTQFFKMITPDITIDEALSTILNQIGLLSGARHLLLLEQSSASQDVCYSIANWSYSDAKNNAVSTKDRFESTFRHFRSPNQESLSAEVEAKGQEIGLVVRQSTLQVDVPEHCLYAGTEKARWIICILDLEHSGYENVLPAYLWGNPMLLNSLFLAGAGLFSQYLEAHIRNTIRTLNRYTLRLDTHADHEPLKELLQTTANELQKAISCESVLIYHEEYAPKVICTSPHNDKLINVGIENISLSANTLENGLTQFVFDAQAEYPVKPGMNMQRLREIAEHLDRDRIHSWLATPIVADLDNNHETQEDQIKRGIIKVVTTEDQAYLNIANVKLLEAVAQRTFRQVSELQHHQMLVVLNDICNELAPLHGKNLSRALVSSLRDKWLVPYIRHDCELVVLARTKDGDQLVFGCSEEIRNLQQEHWTYLSKQLNDGQVHTFSGRQKIEFGKDFNERLNRQAMAVPISIPGDAELCGHFFLFSAKKLKQYQANSVKEAVKELSAILYQEKQFHDWRADSGIYRHTILSATQGIASNAKLISRNVNKLMAGLDETHAETTEKIRQSSARLHSSIVKIRNWSHFQKILYAAHIDPNYKLLDLKSDVELWTARFQEMADTAFIKLRINTEYRVSKARYDGELIDVAFSNLIENGIKYSPRGEEVVVSYRLRDNKVRISVQNIGPSIPDEIRKTIFDYGVRGVDQVTDTQDEVPQASTTRIIPGQGIGLYLARKVVESHYGGKLALETSRSSVATGPDDASVNTFYMEFEHQLGKAERRQWR